MALMKRCDIHYETYIVAVSLEVEILQFKDSRDQTTHEYILPTEGDATDIMTCIMNSIIMAQDSTHLQIFQK